MRRIAFAIALTIASSAPAFAQLVAGPNVNVVGGPACSKADPDDTSCPFQVFGDVSIQRQNEGSMACSSRNPLTCLAAGNDYRLINVPGVADGKVTADAWLGIYWSRNGGQSWRSTLLPGWKTTGSTPEFKDGTPEGSPASNPIAGFEAAADPTVRVGTHGLFYISGIAFNRAEESGGVATTQSGGEGKSGVQFVSVYIDDNNSSDPNVPPRYLRTSVVDAGTSGRFLDKPWIIADVPRGLASCTIPAGPGGQPAAQTVQSGVVYVAYATFLGSGNNPHSDIWIRSSNDCGATWSNGSKVTASIPLSQSPIVVVNPVNGNVQVAWREFGQGGSADRILTAMSSNGGRTFGKVTEIASLGAPRTVSYWPSGVSSAFDQTTLPNAVVTDVRMARTNGYPSACFGTDGRLRVVFSKRILQPGAAAGAIEFARIMLATSSGNGWTVTPIDNHPGPGHQFQPSIACTGTQATVLWYDQRNDIAFSLPPLPWVFFPFVIDPIVPPPAHTVDVRAARSGPNGTFTAGSSIQVSKYPLAYDSDPGSPGFVQLQYNYINWALFGGGVVPFLGDYLEIVPRNPFTPPLCANGACTQLTPWAINDFADESPLTHGLWTDNRDVLQTNDVGSIDWTNYSAPGAACTPGSLTWTRNQNLYSSLLGGGFIMQAEGNARRTKDLEKRAYVVQMQNLVAPQSQDPTTLNKRFRLTFAAGSGEASFNFETDFTNLMEAEFLARYGRTPNPVVTTAYVDLPYASGAARTLFVRKNSTAPVVVLAEEVRAFSTNGTPIPLESCGQSPSACPVVSGGNRSRVIVAPDPLAPVQELAEEIHDADFTILPVQTASGALVNSVTYSSPLISSATVFNDASFATNLLNPTWTSPTWTSPTWTSPTWTSPTWTSPTWTSPTWTSPTWTSPTWTSPTWTSPTWTSQPVITEASYLAEGTGTVASGYDLDALVLSLPQGSVMQVLVSKVSSVPGTDTCTLGNQVILQPVANVTTTTGVANTSFSLAPGEQAVVTLRVACNAPAGCFTPDANTQVVLSKQAPDCTTSPDPVNPDLPKCEQAAADRLDIFDTAAPVITFSPGAPGNTVPGTGSQGAVVPYSASASDLVDALLGVDVTVSCSINGQLVPASSTTRLFQYGTTAVTCTATDSHGNIATSDFSIVVVDTTPPVVTIPGAVTLQASTLAGTPHVFSTTALDNVDGAVSVVCTPVSGSTFEIGATTVTCSAQDAAGNGGTASFVVTVVDTVAPVVTVPPNVVATTVNGAATAPITYSASATDLGQAVQVVCSSSAGGASVFPATQSFPIGATLVTCTASDGRGNSATASFTVTVQAGFGIIGPLSPYQAPPKTYNSGSSIPIAWKFSMGGVAIDSRDFRPELRFVKITGWGRNCATGGTEVANPVLNQSLFISSETPGSSGFQYFGATNPHAMHGAFTWQMNWTAPSQPGSCWNVYIGSLAKGQSMRVARLELK
jgi:HYR domain